MRSRSVWRRPKNSETYENLLGYRHGQMFINYKKNKSYKYMIVNVHIT